MSTGAQTSGSFEQTRLGHLAVERGLLSAAELDAVVGRERDRRAAGRHGSHRWRIGEVLIAERYLTANVLADLLDTQRKARDLPPVMRKTAGKGYEVHSPLLLDYLSFVRREEALELLLVVGRAPAVRVGDDLVSLREHPLDADRMRLVLSEAFDEAELIIAERGRTVHKILDHRFGLFRAVLSGTDAGLVLSCRPVSLDVAESEMRIPRSVARLATLERGLVVVAGTRGVGRANVLAQLVDLVNDRRACHVITIERQISYVHESRRALIAQREVGTHTHSYRAALKGALRQDPDVLVVSEIDDAEAIATAIVAAEAGCLVLCSLHATSPTLAIRRLVDVQAMAQRSMVRATLANCLQAVVVLDVLRGLKGGTRYLVADLLPASAGVTRLIRDDRLHQLSAVASREVGAISRDDLILKLYTAHMISKAVALERLTTPERLFDVEVPR